VLGQADAFPNQAIQRRGIGTTLIEDAKIPIPHIISQDKDDVRMRRHFD
jgi:hypothetical protein